MTGMMKKIHKWERKFDDCAERLVLRHPHVAILVMFIGVPIFTLLAVSMSTVAIMFPLALIFGWM